jgi:aspartate aminotransferase/aminotransferase
MRPLSGIFDHFTRSGVRVLMEMAAQVPDCIHLEVGEPDFPTPPHIVEAAYEAARQGFTKYTSNAGLPSLRETIAAKVRRANGFTCSPDQVVVTPGAVAALALGVLTVAGRDDEVLIPDPGWPNYQAMVALAGARPVRFTLHADHGFQPDPDEIASLVTPRTKAILVNSPGNPTGGVFSPEIAEGLVRLAARRDLYVITDEVYEAFVFEGEHIPLGRFDGEGRVLSIFGFSKTYAMTGWRLGYLVATAELAARAASLLEPFASCASSVSQKAGEAALLGPQDCVCQFRDAYRVRRDLVRDTLAGTGLLAAVPRGAFYALLDVSPTGLTAMDFAKALLEKEKVAVTPCESFGPAGAGKVRISFATADDLLKEGLSRIARFARRP